MGFCVWNCGTPSRERIEDSTDVTIVNVNSSLPFLHRHTYPVVPVPLKPNYVIDEILKSPKCHRIVFTNFFSLLYFSPQVYNRTSRCLYILDNYGSYNVCPDTHNK